MNRIGASCVALVLGAACRHAPVAGAPANPDVHPLGGIVGSPLLVAPVQSMRVAPELAWTALPRATDVLASLDRAVTDTLQLRVGNQQWVYASGLVESAKANPTYAADPHALSVQALRAPNLKIDQRLPEPLATQVRTMLAFHEGRSVLLPVELRFEKTPTGARAVLHLVLVDPRSSNVRWIGDAFGPDSPTFDPSFTALLASHLADLFVAK